MSILNPGVFINLPLPARNTAWPLRKWNRCRSCHRFSARWSKINRTLRPLMYDRALINYFIMLFSTKSRVSATKSRISISVELT